VRFDAQNDRLLSSQGRDLLAEGLQWAAALVPLVRGGQAVPTVEIARNNYDLRQILGRDAVDEINLAYTGWPDRWDGLVGSLVNEHLAARRPFEVFYHSVLGIDRTGQIHIWQLDTDLPGLANLLASEGVEAAGLLDSGGSCALYDPWLGSYLNHGWYFREPRGAILLFELNSWERLPESRDGSWK
jgi:hypothetical protein